MYRIITKQAHAYLEYIDQHVKGVKLSYYNVFKDALKQENIDYNENLLLENINNHDSSKYSKEEFTPYMNHFYSEDGHRKDLDEQDDIEFEYAWLHHIHCNPHHWQYFILIHDTETPKETYLDMPIEYIIEMLCDWNSFSSRNPESTAKTWYDSNKDEIKLSENTRKIVEQLVKYSKPVQE